MKRYIERPREVLAEQWRGPGHALEGVERIPDSEVSWGIRMGSSGFRIVHPGSYVVKIMGEPGVYVLSPGSFRRRYALSPEEEFTGRATCPVLFKGEPCCFPEGHEQPCAFDCVWFMEPVLKRGETKRELWERLAELLHDGSITIRGFFWDEPGGSSAVYWPEGAEALEQAILDPAMERDLEEVERLAGSPRPPELAGVEEDSDPPEGRA